MHTNYQLVVLTNVNHPSSPPFPPLLFLFLSRLTPSSSSSPIALQDGKLPASTFDPSRFAEGNKIETNGDFLGFGHGLHKCPGKPFAILDLKVRRGKYVLEYSH